MTTGPRSQCDTCTRLRSPFSVPRAERPAGPFCTAFPAGIPTAILENGLDHRQPIDGDHGLRWESAGEDFPEWAFLPDRIGVGGKP